jgi:hypothetical protein
MERLNSQRGRKLSPEQRKQLEEALKGLPPSGPEFKAIMATLKADGGMGPYEEMQDDGPFDFGWPTLDFMMKDPEYEEFQADRRGPISPENVNPGSTGYDSSGKRPEPGDTRPADTSLPAPAEAADEGKTEWGTDLGPYNMLEGIQPGLSYNPDANPMDENSLLESMGLATGNEDEYTFDDVTLGMRGVVAENPELYANILYGDSPMKQEMMSPFLASAGALASTGAIGPSYGNDLRSGAKSPTMRMQAMEDVANTMNQPGMQFVDPGAIYGDMFSRASNTYAGENAAGAGDTTIEQIDLTNQALMQAAPYMAGDAQDYLAARLEQARLEYLSKIATGEMDMTYPAYLQSIGADKWIQG